MKTPSQLCQQFSTLGMRTALMMMLVIVAGLAVFGRGTSPVAAESSVDIASAGPLTHVYIGAQLGCQVAHTLDGATLEFYHPAAIPGDCGTFLVVDGTMYAPDFGSHITTATVNLGAYTAFTPVSQTGVTGTGTAGDPYKVVTVADAGVSGIRVTQTDSYVIGQESYRTDTVISNTSGVTKSVLTYHAADCYLGGSDFGYGYVDVATKTVACTKTANNTPADRIEQFSPITPADHYSENRFATIWSQLGTHGPLPNSCTCATNLDNGIAIDWDRTIAAGGAVTLSMITTFSPLGSQPIVVSKVADSATTPAGGNNGYTITITNPNATAVTVNTIQDMLPAGFTYVAGSTTGVTTSNPGIVGQVLTWTGPFNLPANDDISLHFNATVSDTPGIYYNEATATADEADAVPTGPTAPVEVTLSTDFEKVSVDVDGPAEIDVSEDVVITVTSVVANNGPDAGTASDTLSVSAPFDCEVTPEQYTDQVTLEPEAQQTITHTFTIHCLERSSHSFVFCNTIEAASDPAPENNGPLCDTYTVAAFDQTDVKVTSLAVNAPAIGIAGVPFNVSIDATVHNNGPITPLQGEGGIGLAVPPGCVANPNVPYQLVNPINGLDASANVVISKIWQVTCDFPGVYNFVACGRAGPLTLHVRDSQTNNNFMWTGFTVEVMAEGPGPDPNAGRCSILGDPPEKCDNGIDDDGDTFVDEEPDLDADGASDCVDPDDDGDGYSDAVEQFMGTDPIDSCPDSLVDPAFPPDFNNDRSVSIADVLILKASFNTSDGDSAYSQRNDVDASGTINISDVLALKGPFGTSCS